MQQQVQSKRLDSFLGFDKPFAQIRDAAMGFNVICNPRPCKLGAVGNECLGDYVEAVIARVDKFWEMPYQRAGKRSSEYFIPREFYAESILTDVVDVLGENGCSVLIERASARRQEGLRFAHLLVALGYACWGKYRDSKMLDQLGVSESMSDLSKKAQKDRMIEGTPADQRAVPGKDGSPVLRPQFRPTREALNAYQKSFQIVTAAAPAYVPIVYEESLKSAQDGKVTMWVVLRTCLCYLPEILGDQINVLLESRKSRTCPSLGEVMVSLGFPLLELIYQRYNERIETAADVRWGACGDTG